MDSSNFPLFDNRPTLGLPNGGIITAVDSTLSAIEPSGGVKTGIDQ